MIKNKEQQIIDNVVSRLKKILVTARIVNTDGNVTEQEIPIKIENDGEAKVQIMRCTVPNSSASYPKQSNAYNIVDKQHSLVALIEIIVRETLAVVIKETEISFKERFDVLEAHFDALVSALATVGVGGLTDVPLMIGAYKLACPKSIRDNLKILENLEGTNLK